MREHIKSLASLKILLVEDSKTDAALIEKALIQAIPDIHPIYCVENLASALRTIGEHQFDVALLDLSLPDSSEFNGLISIQNMAPTLPIIILTAHADEDLALDAVGNGAQDYLFKDKTNGHVIKRAMQFAIQRKQFEGILITQAHFDSLTGLANRTLFESRLDLAIARSKRTGDGFGVLFMDLDHFKCVNDSLGHAAGDRLLRLVGERIKQSIRGYDTAARFGGDEFAIIIEGIKRAEDCAIVAQKIIERLDAPFMLIDMQTHIGVSIGIATCFAEEELSREILVERADEAMYRAKKAPQSDYQFYNAEQKIAFNRKVAL